MTTILATLVDTSDRGEVPAIHTYSLTVVHILRTIKSQTSPTQYSKSGYLRETDYQLGPSLPEHVGILDNELADHDAKRAPYRGNVKLKIKQSHYKSARHNPC